MCSIISLFFLLQSHVFSVQCCLCVSFEINIRFEQNKKNRKMRAKCREIIHVEESSEAGRHADILLRMMLPAASAMRLCGCFSDHHRYDDEVKREEYEMMMIMIIIVFIMM